MGVRDRRLDTNGRTVLKLAMQASRMGAWERDVAADTVWWSEELEEIFGLRKGEFRGTREHFYELMDARDRDIAWAAVERAIEAREPFQYEFRFRHTDGSIRWMEGRGEATYTESGQPNRLFGVGIDITERKASEEKSKFLTALAQTVQRLSDPAEVMQVTAQMLGDHVGADRCAYAEIDDESVFVITGDYAKNVPSIVGRWPVAAFGPECTRQMLADEPYIVYDSEDDARIGPEDLPAYRATAIRSVICLPLHKNGIFTAAMAVHQKTPRVWTAAEVELVQEVVGRCWESLERARAERAVRESDERFRLALSTGAVTVYEQDLDLRYRWVYPTAPYRPDVIGKTDLELAPGPGSEKREQLKRSVIETGEPLRAEISATVNGREIWYDLYIEPRRDEAGAIVGVGGVALDITERRRAEANLAEQSELLRVTLTSIGDAVIAADVEGRITFMNTVAESLTGWRKEDVIGEPLQDVFNIVNETSRRTVENPAERALREGAIVGLANHTVLIARNGTEHPIDDSAAPIRDDAGNIVGAVLVFRDIAKRREADRQIARLAAIVEHSRDAIVGKDLDGLITSWNAGAERIFGYTATEAVGRSVMMLIPPGREDEEMLILARIRSGETVDHYETVRRRKDGSLIDVAVSVSPLVDADGEVVGASKIARDITENKRAEAAVRERAIMERLVEAQESERQRIARDLHDQLGQQMTALRFKLQSLGGGDDASENVEAIRNMAAAIDRDIGYLSWELRPTELDKLGLENALASFVREWSNQYSIAAEFHAELDPPVAAKHPRLPPRMETQLYRVVQEALNNILKHAAARHVNVVMLRKSDHLVLIVEDDGRGFEHNTSDGDRVSKGLGLIGMRERIALLNGTMEIETGEGAGTTVLARVPIPVKPDRGSRQK